MFGNVLSGQMIQLAGLDFGNLVGEFGWIIISGP